ncbi:CCGSCS motif protein [Photobacterium minamisatsumaniensis]|uniref:CCGSCS motif protein n=1 Tax=Photobacterium minamisatsumaniensis TaxID=2910233 RepID=UPI003D111171
MTLSFKKIFKKDDVKSENTAVEQAPAVASDSDKQAKTTNTEQKKGKHGEPGFCCGSCS